MSITRFKNWRIQYKIMLISVISVAVMVTGLFAYLLPLIETRIMNEKKDATRHIVELAMGIVEHQNADVKAGKISLEQAQREAAGLLKHLRSEKKE